MRTVNWTASGVEADGERGPVRRRIAELMLASLLGCALVGAASAETLEVFPFPAIAGEPLQAVVSGLSASCSGTPTVEESFRGGGVVILELDDPGCPLLPPGPFDYSAAVELAPLGPGSYTVELRPSGGTLPLTSTELTVLPGSSLDGALEVHPVGAGPGNTFLDRDKVALELGGSDRGCFALVEGIEIEAAPVLGEIEVVVGLSCLLDPPLQSELDLPLELGFLPVGSYRVTARIDGVEGEARNFVQVVYDPAVEIINVSPLNATDKDELTALVLLPGLQTCAPLMGVFGVDPVSIRIDTDCINSSGSGTVAIAANFGPLLAGEREIVLVDRDLNELARTSVQIVQGGSCEPSETKLCLDRQRFAATALWRTASGTQGPGHGLPGPSGAGNASGTFWFFDPLNTELDLKVLNGCAINDHYWVFAAGLTDVGVLLRIEDTTSGEIRWYGNDLGTPFSLVRDLEGFPCN